jgi:hypothetical protein
MPREVPVRETAAAPRFYPVEAPPAPHFHPELGYLLPSALLRRGLRRAAVAALVGSAIAASTALALMPRPPIEGVHQEEPVIAAAAPAVAIEASPAIQALPMQPPRVLTPRVLPRPHAQGACDDLSTAFLAADCRSGRIGKARLAHARAGHKLATVTIGRAEREVVGEERSSPAAAPSAAEAQTLPKPPATTVPAKPKPPVKTVRKERPSQEAVAADPGAWGGNSGGSAFPRSVLPFRLGGNDWARSW